MTLLLLLLQQLAINMFHYSEQTYMSPPFRVTFSFCMSSYLSDFSRMRASAAVGL